MVRDFLSCDTANSLGCKDESNIEDGAFGLSVGSRAGGEGGEVTLYGLFLMSEVTLYALFLMSEVTLNALFPMSEVTLKALFLMSEVTL